MVSTLLAFLGAEAGRTSPPAKGPTPCDTPPTSCPAGYTRILPGFLTIANTAVIAVSVQTHSGPFAFSRIRGPAATLLTLPKVTAHGCACREVASRGKTTAQVTRLPAGSSSDNLRSQKAKRHAPISRTSRMDRQTSFSAVSRINWKTPAGKTSSPSALRVIGRSASAFALDRGFGVVGDRVWSDLNANGTQDAGEPDIRMQSIGQRLHDVVRGV